MGLKRTRREAKRLVGSSEYGGGSEMVRSGWIEIYLQVTSKGPGGG